MVDKPVKGDVTGQYISNLNSPYLTTTNWNTANPFYASGAKDTNFGWFGPLDPLYPIAPPEVAGRQFDYQAGYNLNTVTRPYSAVPFWHLRALADGYDILRIIIETRKNEIARKLWAIKPREEDGNKEDPDIKRIEQFFRRPDGIHDFNSWLKMLVEDLFVIDAPTVYVHRNKGGQMINLFPIAGDTIKPVIDDWGRRPGPIMDAGKIVYPVAYQQILHGYPAIDYSMRDLIYRPMNVRTNHVYGYSIVEQIIGTIQVGLRRQGFLLDYYEDGTIPDCLIGTPDTWTPDQISAYQRHWDSYFDSNLARKRKAKFVPGGVAKTFIQTKEPELKGELDEWIARVCCKAFAISPTGFVRDSNRATAQVASNDAEAQGLQPVLDYLVDFINYIIEIEFGRPDLTFAWQEDNEVSATEQQTILNGYVTTGQLTINESRAIRGLPPLPDAEANQALVMTANGYVPLNQQAAVQQKVNEQKALLPLQPKPVVAPQNNKSNVKKTFDPNEPRDEHGRWTEGGETGTHTELNPKEKSRLEVEQRRKEKEAKRAAKEKEREAKRDAKEQAAEEYRRKEREAKLAAKEQVEQRRKEREAKRDAKEQAAEEYRKQRRQYYDEKARKKDEELAQARAERKAKREAREKDLAAKRAAKNTASASQYNANQVSSDVRAQIKRQNAPEEVKRATLIAGLKQLGVGTSMVVGGHLTSIWNASKDDPSTLVDKMTNVAIEKGYDLMAHGFGNLGQHVADLLALPSKEYKELVNETKENVKSHMYEYESNVILQKELDKQPVDTESVKKPRTNWTTDQVKRETGLDGEEAIAERNRRNGKTSKLMKMSSVSDEDKTTILDILDDTFENYITLLEESNHFSEDQLHEIQDGLDEILNTVEDTIDNFNSNTSTEKLFKTAHDVSDEARDEHGRWTFMGAIASVYNYAKDVLTLPGREHAYRAIMKIPVKQLEDGSYSDGITISNKPDNVKAMTLYGSSFYGETNSYLRTGIVNSAKDKEAALDKTRLNDIISGIDDEINSNKLSENQILYRGVRNLKLGQIQEGDIIQDKAFSSTSPSLNIAKSFAGKTGKGSFGNSYNAIFEINAPKGTNAAIMKINPELDDSGEPDERILARNIKLKATEVNEKTGHIKFEVVQ